MATGKTITFQPPSEFVANHPELLKDDLNPHFCKSCALKCRRILDREEVHARKEIEEHTAAILHSPMDLQVRSPPVPKQQNGRGRPEKYSAFERLQLAISAAKGTNLSQVGVNFAIFNASNEQELKNIQPPSRTVVTQALAELNQCFKRHLAQRFSSSTSLNLVVDATTDSHRELLAISFGGLSSSQEWWSHACAIFETKGHKAVTQCQLVVTLLHEINKIQKEMVLFLFLFSSFFPWYSSIHSSFLIE